MIESFPFGSIADHLDESDFSLFENSYIQLLNSRLFFSGTVHFLRKVESLPRLQISYEEQKQLRTKLRRVLEGTESTGVIGDALLLGFPVRKGASVAVVVCGVDSVITERASLDWLEEVREDLHREFILVKQAYKDAETGLLNSIHFFSVLESQTSENDISVLLVDIPSFGKRSGDGFRNAQRAAATLTSATDNRFKLHHLGQCVFGLLVRSKDIESIDEFSSGLVQVFKKEKFEKVHLGSSHRNLPLSEEVPENFSGRQLIDQAWTALQAARRRGPFGFCDFSLLACKDKHPLSRARQSIADRFRRLSNKDKSFCLLKVGGADLGKVREIFRAGDLLPENSTIITDQNDLYIYLAETEGEQALAVANMLLKGLKEAFNVSDVYMGVSKFPLLDLTKKATLANAQKALLHAEFFGSGHAVLFDEVSLNISGDIYFGDGDLPKAVKEYRKGLELKGDDVNLLNSLGVAYALLNKTALARKTFELAVALEPHNYMALYNIGLGAQLREDLPTAIESFELALAYCVNSEENEGIVLDLKLQLGVLYCQTNRFNESLEYLNEWLEKASERQHGRAFRFLGESYLGSGEPRQAMYWLERAMQRNEFDHEVMSLFGCAILEAKQGADIALSLCSRAVDLMPADQVLRLRLAGAQQALGQYKESLANLNLCRGKKVSREEVQIMKAEAYLGMHNAARAKKWAEKCADNCSRDSEFLKRAQAIIKIV